MGDAYPRTGGAHESKARTRTSAPGAPGTHMAACGTSQPGDGAGGGGGEVWRGAGGAWRPRAVLLHGSLVPRNEACHAKGGGAVSTVWAVGGGQGSDWGPVVRTGELMTGVGANGPRGYQREGSAVEPVEWGVGTAGV